MLKKDRILRRRRAFRLLDKGHSQEEVGRILGCHASTIMRWRKERESKCGSVYVYKHSHGGRPSKLSKQQRDKLLKILCKGAIAYGYPTKLWKLKMICEVIEKEFGVVYEQASVRWLIRRYGWDVPVKTKKQKHK